MKKPAAVKPAQKGGAPARKAAPAKRVTGTAAGPKKAAAARAVSRKGAKRR